MRVTGAQGMARLGLDLWAIQLLGRWGSNAALGYVRLAHLDVAELWARRAAAGRPLETIVKELVEVPQAADESLVLPRPTVKDGVAQTDVTEALLHEVEAERLKESEKLAVVLSDANVFHAVLHGPPEADLFSSKTVCGWRFGRSGAALRRRCDLPSSHKALCQKCFPELRAALKEELALAARRLGEACEPGPAAGAHVAHT